MEKPRYPRNSRARVEPVTASEGELGNPAALSGALRQTVLLARTVRHLQPAQVAHRIRSAALRSALARVPALGELVLRPPPIAGARWPAGFSPIDESQPSADSATLDVAKRRLTVLGQTRPLGSPPDWAQASAPRLWRFHLHYFEWAWALRSDANRHDARESFLELWSSWRGASAFPRGDAWSPYVASVRAWVFCGVYQPLVAGSRADDEFVADLAMHAAFIATFLERDLGGNHLVKNLKALIGLGVFLGDDRLVERSIARLAKQLGVQVLDDGGHFERSPSYHCQVLGDLLDVAGLLGAAGHSTVPALRWAVTSMQHWLGEMLLPDGDVPLFNDCTLVGPGRVNALGPRFPPPTPLRILQPSGYAVARPSRDVHLVADVGPPCPPELPAHAHADCLSFELALAGRRVLVDSGTSTYEPSPTRQHERSTAAHNTVSVDGQDQSEVWSVFRVGRRAEPLVEGSRVEGSVVKLVASHDGYERLPGRPRHRRTFQVSPAELALTDEVLGEGTHKVSLFLHVHPDIVHIEHHGDVVRATPITIEFGGPGKTVVHAPGTGLISAVAMTFGGRTGATVVERRVYAQLPVQITARLAWTGVDPSPR